MFFSDKIAITLEVLVEMTQLATVFFLASVCTSQIMISSGLNNEHYRKTSVFYRPRVVTSDCNMPTQTNNLDHIHIAIALMKPDAIETKLVTAFLILPKQV